MLITSNKNNNNTASIIKNSFASSTTLLSFLTKTNFRYEITFKTSSEVSSKLSEIFNNITEDFNLVELKQIDSETYFIRIRKSSK